MRFPRVAAAALAALAADGLRAQVAWEQVPALAGRTELAMAYDPARGLVIAFGGRRADTGAFCADTMIWTGSDWFQASLATSPSARGRHAMVYDPIRGGIVLFGGRTSASQPLGDTWFWDGASWHLQSPVVSPPALDGAAMAWDAGRGVVLLHGGRDTSGLRSETWQWNGTTWAQLTPTNSPPARARHAMAYDARRDVVVLWGGECYSPFFWCNLEDTWEWDGVDWTHRNPPNRPPSRWAHSLTYDPIRQRVVMFGGGEEPQHSSGDTWEWDGVDWTQLPFTVTHPPSREAHAATWDGSRVLVFGGRQYMSMIEAQDDTWGYDAAGWTEVRPPFTPPWRIHAGMAWDDIGRRTLMFHGDPIHSSSGTWLFDGASWAKPMPSTEPSPRYDYALAPLPGKGGILMYGGQFGRTWFDETWHWDGRTWRLLAPRHRPPVLCEHAMVADTDRARVVLFGGRTSYPKRSDDTWVFDGADWRVVSAGPRPSARSWPAMTYDAARGSVVLFGGQGPVGDLSDTWTFTGAQWVQQSPANRPPAGCHAIAFDAARGIVVLQVAAGGTWEWDGADWTQRSTTLAPPTSFDPLVQSWDPVHARTVLYHPRFGTWRYGADPAAIVTRFGQGCAGAHGIPWIGSATGYGPAVGASFELVARAMPAHPTGFLRIGVSDTLWNGVPLPIDLGAIGMTGCSVLVSGEALAAFPVANGTGSWSAPIPADPSLLAARFHVQALGVDATANAVGLVLSDALTVGIGGR